MLSSSPPTAPPTPGGAGPQAIAGVPSAQFAQLFAQLTQVLSALDTDSRANAALIATTIGDALAAIGGAYETGAWTPNLIFGGATTGITYTSQSGLFTRTYRVVIATFEFILSSKGSASGIATIGTLPFSSNAVAANLGNGGVCTQAANLAGLTGVPYMFVGAGSSGISPFQMLPSGTLSMSDANFTNTSVMAGAVTYFI
jgi:hypothetical protein